MADKDDLFLLFLPPREFLWYVNIVLNCSKNSSSMCQLMTIPCPLYPEPWKYVCFSLEKEERENASFSTRISKLPHGIKNPKKNTSLSSRSSSSFIFLKMRLMTTRPYIPLSLTFGKLSFTISRVTHLLQKMCMNQSQNFSSRVVYDREI